MEDELNQFIRNDVGEFFQKPLDQNIIRTKWVYKNKLDDSGSIIRNKNRLVAQGYTQIEGIVFEESFAPVARLEAIRLLLAFACFKDFNFFQMDIKSAFMNGYIDQNVFVEQPPAFESINFPNHIYKLKKTLYDLNQASSARYDRLSNFLIEHNFRKG